MLKNSFTLFETILAITIISILIGGFIKSSNQTPLNTTHLQKINNEFSLNKLENMTLSKFGFSYVQNSQLDVTISTQGNHQKITYDKNHIFFEKHDLLINKSTLNSKVFQ